MAKVLALEDLKVLAVWRTVRSGGQHGGHALLAVLVEEHASAIAPSTISPVGWRREDGHIVERLVGVGRRRLRPCQHIRKDSDHRGDTGEKAEHDRR